MTASRLNVHLHSVYISWLSFCGEHFLSVRVDLWGIPPNHRISAITGKQECIPVSRKNSRILWHTAVHIPQCMRNTHKEIDHSAWYSGSGSHASSPLNLLVAAKMVTEQSLHQHARKWQWDSWFYCFCVCVIATVMGHKEYIKCSYGFKENGYSKTQFQGYIPHTIM